MSSQINQRVFELNTMGESGSSNEFIVGTTADGKSAVKLGGVMLINDGGRTLEIDGAISTDVTPSKDSDLVTKKYVDDSNLLKIDKTGPAISINEGSDDIQAIITSNNSFITKGNISAIISSDVCIVGSSSTDKNGRQTIISSKSSKTNGNDTVVIAARESEIISDDNSHSTESAIIGGYLNTINKTQRAVIAGGSENTIVPVSEGSDALYGFIGGGQNNQVKYRNSATIGGQHLTTTNPEQVLVGRYNRLSTLPDNDILFAVGTGTSSARNNGFWVSSTKTFIEKPEIGSSLRIYGGDSSSAAKIMLDQDASGQITDNGTKTIFGFTSSGATDLKVGSTSYLLTLRGSDSHPTYNNLNIPTIRPAPGSSSASGNAGDIAYDSNYLYICTGHANWKRVALSSF